MKVASGICRAESRNEVIYALDCGGAYGLVDVGGEAGLDAKLAQLESDGIDLCKIAAIFVTHCHQDHAGAIPRLCADHPLRVVAHRLAVEHLRLCPAYTPIDADLVHYTVDHGDTVELGDLALQVHHLPGHTPDSVAWQLGDSLFVGDLLRCDGSLGWMDIHWGSCVGDYRSSLQKLLELDVSTIYPGHGECGPITPDVVETALHRLKTLTEADGKLLTSMGRPAPRRAPETPAKILSLPTGLPTPS